MALCRVAAGRTRESVGPHTASDNRLSRFRHCGEQIGVWRHKTDGTYRLRGNFCRDRFCPSCARQRRIRLHSTLKRAFRDWSTQHPQTPPRLLTLTLKHDHSTIHATAKRLKTCWRAFQQDPWFQREAHAGVWCMECKHAPARDEWHVHLHAVVFCHWLAWSTIRAKWHAITGDSYIVDIRAIRPSPLHDDVTQAALYVAKYISKPAWLAGAAPQAAADMITGLKHQRLWSTWGGFRKLIAEIRAADEDLYDPADWLYVSPLAPVVLSAMRGEPQAASIIAQLGLDRSPGQLRPVHAMPAPDRRPLSGGP